MQKKLAKDLVLGDRMDLAGKTYQIVAVDRERYTNGVGFIMKVDPKKTGFILLVIPGDWEVEANLD